MRIATNTIFRNNSCRGITQKDKILFLCIFFLLSWFGMSAQDSNVTISVDWPRWSSENKVELYSPDGTLITEIIDTNEGYTGCCDSDYTFMDNLGVLPDGENYYIIMYDLSDNGWDNAAYVSVTSDISTVVFDYGNSAVASGATVFFDLCSGSVVCQVTSGCSNNLLGDGNFDDPIIPLTNFLYPGQIFPPVPLNCFEGPSLQWFYDDGENLLVPVTKIRDASRASDGDQFAYLPTFPTSITQNNRCYGNLMTTVSNFACLANTLQNGSRYVVSMDYVPFNRNFPNGGPAAGKTVPRMEHQFPDFTVLYDSNGNNISQEGPYGDLTGYKTAVAWADVGNSWETVYGVTPALNIGAFGTMYFSHANDGTSGMLLDNASVKMLTFDNIGLGALACGDDDELTFTLNPNANVGTTPNIKYTVSVPDGFTIAPTEGVYGEVTSFVITNVADGDFTDGSPSGVELTVVDEVNIGIGVVQTLDVPAVCIKPAANLGDYVWMDDDGNGEQNGAEVGVAGIAVNLYDAADNIVASTKTDAYGHYLFNRLEPATYTVGFLLPPNYTFTNPNQGTSLVDSNVDPITGRTAAITLVNGDNNMDADAGLVYAVNDIATVGDRLWLDEDENGLEGAAELGVSFATVTLYDVTGVRVLSTLTDSKGYYSFSGLKPGTYQVGFTLPVNYKFTNQTSGTVDGSDANINTGLSDPFTLVAGEKKTDIDAGIILQDLARSSLGNSVWIDINNNGLREISEVGLEGVIVNLFEEGNSTAIQSTMTNDFGEYVFNNLFSGNYYLEFDPTSLPIGWSFVSNDAGEDRLDSDVGNFNGPNTTDIITLEAGSRNMSLDAGVINPAGGTGSIGSFIWYDTNMNGIQDSGEVGVKGISAILYDDLGNIVSKTVSSRHGYYIFPNLEAGTYQIEFSNLPSGYIFSALNAAATSNDSDVDGRGLTNMISIGTGENKLDVDVGLHVGQCPSGTASIGNMVFSDLNNNGIHDDGELGIGSVVVNLLDANNTILATQKTNEGGNFMFTGLGKEDYYIEFDPSSFPVGYQLSPKDVTGTTDKTDSDADILTGLTDVIKLCEGEDALTVDAGLYKPTVQGSIGDLVWFDSNGNGLYDTDEFGVQGIMITLYDDAKNKLAVTVTDKNGNYIFDDLPDGDYKLQFANLPIGYSFVNQAIGTVNGSDPNGSGLTDLITIAGGARVTDVDGGLIGNVAMLGDYVWYDLNNNGVQDAIEDGIAGVTVSLLDNLGNVVSKTITDASGHYTFANLLPGIYRVSFSTLPLSVVYSASDNASDDKTDTDVNPETGESSAINLAGGTVNNTLDGGVNVMEMGSIGDFVWVDNVVNNGEQDPTELGLSGVTATLYDASDNPIAISVTNEEGNYSFDRVEEGFYYIKFSNLPEDFQMTIQDEGSETQDSDADRGTFETPVYNIAGNHNDGIDAGIAKLALRGIAWLDSNINGFRDLLELDLAGVSVSLYEADGTLVGTKTTNLLGFYEFIGLREGDYYLEFDEGNNLNGLIIFSPTVEEANGSTDLSDANDSDISIATRRTPVFNLDENATIRNVDAGFSTIPLPVELLYFTAEFNDNCDAALKWSTATEENNSHFFVEHSIDGTNFKPVAQIQGAGNSTEILEYAYVHRDYEVEAGVNYYRLKQVDTDGTYEYSEVMELNTISCKNSEVNFVSIFPNPTRSNLQIEIISKSAYEAEYYLMDVSGKTMSTETFEINEGGSTLKVNLDGLEGGTYFLKIVYGHQGTKEVFKITKLN